MNYRLCSTSQPPKHNAILEQTTTYTQGISWLFRALAVSLWLAGAVITLTHGLRWPLPALTWWLLGGGCLSWALHLLIAPPWRMPIRFVFDNQLGALIMEGKDNQHRPLEARLPYEDIRAFRVRRIDHQPDGRPLRHFEVEMQKNDGAFWTLHRAAQRDQAEAVCEALEAGADLYDSPTHVEESFTSAGQIEIAEHSDHTALTWRERTPARNGLCWLWLNLGLLCLALPLQASLPPLVWQIGLGCFALFAVFGASFALLSLERKHTITISDQEVTYQPAQASLDYEGFRMNAKEIHTILFNFSLDPSASRLYVLRPGETSNLLKHKRGQASMGRASTEEKLLRHIHKIDAKELSFAEQLHLEYALQHIIQRRCDHKVE